MEPLEKQITSSPRASRVSTDDGDVSAGRNKAAQSAGQQRRKREHEDDYNDTGADYSHIREPPPPPQQQHLQHRQHLTDHHQHHHQHHHHHHHAAALHSYSHRPYSSYEHHSFPPPPPPPSEHMPSASHYHDDYYSDTPRQRSYFGAHHRGVDDGGGAANGDTAADPSRWARGLGEGSAHDAGSSPSYPHHHHNHNHNHHLPAQYSGASVFLRSPAVRPTPGAVVPPPPRHSVVRPYYRSDGGYGGGDGVASVEGDVMRWDDSDSVGQPRAAQRPPRRDPYAPVRFRNDYGPGQFFEQQPQQQQVQRGSGGGVSCSMENPGATAAAALPTAERETDQPLDRLNATSRGSPGNAGGESAPSQTSSGMLMSLQREFDVLRQSFTELQKLYGEKCGEVILLRKTVESLQRQISWRPLIHAGGAAGSDDVSGTGAGGGGGASDRALSVASSSCVATTSSVSAAMGCPPASKAGFAASTNAVNASGTRPSNASPTQSHPPTSGAAWKCDVCQLVLNSESVLDAHLRGQKHLRTVQRALRGGGAASRPAPSLAIAAQAPRASTAPSVELGANGTARGGEGEGYGDDSSHATRTAPAPPSGVCTETLAAAVADATGAQERLEVDAASSR